MKNKLSGKGFYVFFIPLFFVLHGYNENFGLISFGDCLLLLVTYWAGTIIVYFATWLLYRNHLKASLLTAALLCIFFLFGTLQDFLKTYLHTISRYQIILPAIFIAICCLAIYLKKSGRRFNRVTFFLNILMAIYLSVDFVDFTWKSLHPNEDKLSIYGEGKKYNYSPCNDCKNPDIYFLLFDEFSSTENLKQNFQYDNSELDSFLLKRGFSIQVHSHTNYNFTYYSMASMLNLNYISGIKDVQSLTSQDNNRCTDLIRNSEVIRFLSSRKYEIVNYSIFDLAGSPALIRSEFFPPKTRLITDQTLFNRVMRDVGWHLYSVLIKFKWLSRNNLYENLNNNNEILNLLIRESGRKIKTPRFVYAHFLMPHPPFYFDKNSRMRDEKILSLERNVDHIDSYVGYIPYTTGKVKELIDTIEKNTNNKAVIILMGDHGYRAMTNPEFHNYYYENLNAVYFPDQDYRLMTDSINGVNQFRAIFNTLFKQNLPLLKDSTIFLKDNN
jgi:hypothetical protein